MWHENNLWGHMPPSAPPPPSPPPQFCRLLGLPINWIVDMYSNLLTVVVLGNDCTDIKRSQAYDAH